MRILVNGQTRDVSAQRLDAVLQELGYRNAVVATAVNGEFVPHNRREQRTLVESDRLEIVAPMQGG